MKILFMCVANSARSQLAEAIAKSVFKKEAQIFSAGSNPKSVHPLTLECLQANRLETEGLWSKSVVDLPEEFRNSVDYIITLCAEEVCPILPNTRAHKLHWPIPDPASSESVEGFKRVFDILVEQINLFHLNLGSKKATY